MKKIIRKIQKVLFHEQWSLLLCDTTGKLLRQIVPQKGCIWADPFIVEDDNRTFVFVEQQFERMNGTLGYIEIFEDLSVSEFREILARPHHLSYPHVFRVLEDGKPVWYMIPESNENGTIDLYRSTSFPDTWEYDSCLFSDTSAVDSTVFFDGSIWWLFTSIRSENTAFNSSLSVFWSETFPSTNWIPHQLNPVVSGSHNSRMAGAIFLNAKNGKLIRPAQSCTREYGEKTVLNHIKELTPYTYVEESFEEILPERHLDAVCTHTINRSENYILRDIKTRKRKFSIR